MLRPTLEAVPIARVGWEETDTTPAGEHLLLFWAETDDFESFEDALLDDETVARQRMITEFKRRRLY